MSKIKFVFLLIIGFIIYKGFVAIKNFEIGVDKEVAQIEKMGFEKQDKVIGLMMYLGDPDDLDLIEHLLVENKEKCFEMKVIAEENSNAYYECAKLKAVVKEGKIIKIITALQGAISGGNAGISFEIGGTAVTGGGITVAHSGSAAGTIDSAEPTAANAYFYGSLGCE